MTKKASSPFLSLPLSLSFSLSHQVSSLLFFQVMWEKDLKTMACLLRGLDDTIRGFRLSLHDPAGTAPQKTFDCVIYTCFYMVHISAHLKCMRHRWCEQDINCITAGTVDVTKDEEEK